MKRYLIFLIIILAFAAAGSFYFLSGKKTIFSNNKNLYKAVPVTSPFFFEVSSIKNIPADNPVISEWSKNGIGSQWFKLLHQTDSLIDNTEEIHKSLRGNPFLLAFGYIGKNELIPLLITEQGSKNNEYSLTKLLHTLYPSENFKYTKKEYGKHSITEIGQGSAKGSLYFTFTGDLFLASPRSILIEQVIRQLGTPGIVKNPYFSKVNNSTGTQEVTLYVNHNWLGGFFNNILSRTVSKKTDEFGAVKRNQPAVQADKLRKFAAWSGYDFKAENKLLSLSGASAADDSLNHFLSAFAGQQPVRSNTEQFLPINTSFFLSYSFSGKSLFFKNLETFYTHSAEYYHREERMKRFEQGFRGNIRKIFQDMVKDEIIVAATTIPVNPDNKTVYFILHTEGRTAAEEQLNKLLTTYAARTETNFEQLSSEYTTDNGLQIKIYKFPYPSFPGLWIGSPFGLCDAHFAAFHDNLFIFSNSEQGLIEYISNMARGNTLAKSPGYQQLKRSGANRANINIFLDINKTFSLRNIIFSPDFLKKVNEREEVLRKFNMISYQIRQGKDVWENTMTTVYQSEEQEDARTDWQSVVGANINMKPQLVTNHLDRQNREIIFQDTQNTLHLISSSGKMRWSQNLPEPILGQIHQVDYFKNGKLQFLFNTKEKLYLIDRNGNDVKPFPVRLPANATNGVSIFDYDKNRNYRFFFAGEDRKVYALDNSAKIISGWKFGQTEHDVTTPVQHFKVDGKDYIVFKDKSNIYIQDRQGQTRVTPDVKFENSGNPLVLNLNGKQKIVATDSGGKVWYIFFDGKTEEKKTARFGSGHFFTAEDLDGNDIPDFIFADGNELTVMDENGKKLFSKKLNNPVRYQPVVYTFDSNQKMIGIVDAASNRIFLYSPDGKLYPGFPLQGNSPFTIGKLSENSTGFNLIVASEGGKLYNYSLN